MQEEAKEFGVSIPAILTRNGPKFERIHRQLRIGAVMIAKQSIQDVGQVACFPGLEMLAASRHEVLKQILRSERGWRIWGLFSGVA